MVYKFGRMMAVSFATLIASSISAHAACPTVFNLELGLKYVESSVYAEKTFHATVTNDKDSKEPLYFTLYTARTLPKIPENRSPYITLQQPVMLGKVDPGKTVHFQYDKSEFENYGFRLTCGEAPGTPFGFKDEGLSTTCKATASVSG